VSPVPITAPKSVATIQEAVSIYSPMSSNQSSG
jgi:hypothetical protein